MPIKITSTRIISPEQLKVKTCIYGEAGVGKTVLCGTAPNSIIISAERGLLSLASTDTAAILVNNKSEVDEAYQFLIGSHEAKQYETVCLDSVSEIAEVLLIEKKKLLGDGRLYWPELAEDISSMIRAFRDTLPYHVVFTAKQERNKDEYTGVTSHKPSMPGKNLTNSLPYFFDELFVMRVGDMPDGSGTFRYIQPHPSLDYEAKDRSGALGLTKNLEKPDMTYIINKIKKHIVSNPQQMEKSSNSIQLEKVEEMERAAEESEVEN